MSLPRYPQYKDSGEASLGKIPSHWCTRRLKKVLAEPLMYGANEVADDTTPDNPRFIRITDIGADGELRDDTFRSLPAETARPYLLKDGDILLARSGATVGKSFIYRSSWGTCCFAGYLIKAEVDATIAHADFIYACFQADFYWRHILGEQIQATIQNVSAERYAQLVVPCPPLDEQIIIAAFLDRETGKIDALIAEQERLLTLLAEKRQAAISHAVTRGLNPDAPMKDSGVAWLGKVPTHWGVGALGYLCSIETGATPDRGEPRYWNGSIPWLKTGEINWAPISEAEEFISEDGLANSAAKLAKPGTLLMAMYGQGVTRGRVALLEIEAAYNQACAAMLFGPRMLPSFARYFFMAAYDYVRDSGNETSQMNLSAGLIAKFKLTIPPVDEQADIVRMLDSETTKLDSLNTEAERVIGLLKERRSALIAAAVTGKIDVRGVMAQNTNNNEELAA